MVNAMVFEDGAFESGRAFQYTLADDSGFVGSPDHGHLGVNVGEGSVARSAAAEIIQLRIDLLPGCLVVLYGVFQGALRSTGTCCATNPPLESPSPDVLGVAYQPRRRLVCISLRYFLS
jgi:hypothetical protein